MAFHNTVATLATDCIQVLHSLRRSLYCVLIEILSKMSVIVHDLNCDTEWKRSEDIYITAAIFRCG